ncbi:hypothetical protein EOB59_28900 [Mesorhizobium sp. M7A.F.Ca.MR.176.00.0.0]|uniref:hypothetical protein n=1 Tax=Mesorhizobium sp. M7A.F.Ca.MR.176.00.0.0 TaxID=2496776 RepID=UPI000FD39552|nr:hypothetical protein [Mesorhizobium sp. M7A.F.Ca.MR.176.00.0.0]RUU86452.1 hypothetical protein EOB59_28900 [Mesorhizobium sp. M7A.F.Ca.MR.176.00.0.0]
MNAHTPIVKPYGCPQGVDPRTWRQSVETRLNDLLDRAMSLITALDLMEADCDLEETADDEPSLGWGHRGGQSFLSSTAPNLPPGDVLDLELDNADDEEGGDPEPCPDIFGEHVMWPDDMASQETLVRSGL